MKKIIYCLSFVFFFIFSFTFVQAKTTTDVCYYKSDDNKLIFAVKQFDDNTSQAILIKPYSSSDGFSESQNYGANWSTSKSVKENNSCKKYMKYAIKTGSNEIEFSNDSPFYNNNNQYNLTNFNIIKDGYKYKYQLQPNLSLTVIIYNNAFIKYFNDEYNTILTNEYRFEKYDRVYLNDFYDKFLYISSIGQKPTLFLGKTEITASYDNGSIEEKLWYIEVELENFSTDKPIFNLIEYHEPENPDNPENPENPENPDYLVSPTGSYKKVLCGDDYIPYALPQIVKVIYSILKIVTPIIIIIFGMIDFLKAVMTQKEDEIKKGQQTFVKRLIMGALVFLVFFFVEIIIGFVAPKEENQSMWNCVDCFINGNCTVVN